MDISKRVAITKIDDDEQIVWGWAYVVEQDGLAVVDHSGDQVASPDEVKKAAHGFIRDSRVGGVMHESAAGAIVDSIFFSAEVQKALGVDLGKVGWFIGMQVADAEVWKRVKSGELRMFSIGGSAQIERIGDAA